MNRFITRISILIIALFALTGCGKEFTLNVAQFTAGLTTLDAQYNTVAAMVVTNAHQFTDDERAQLNVADQNFRGLQKAARALIANSGGVTQAMIQADQVRLLYNMARTSYLAVRNVICPGVALDMPVSAERCTRLATMQAHEQRMLIDFDQHARRTRDALDGILNAPSGSDVTQLVFDALTIGATAARIARLGLI